MHDDRQLRPTALLTPAVSPAITDRARLIVGSAVLGVTLIFLAGFAAPDIVHNAAHDTRHAAAFPCH